MIDYYLFLDDYRFPNHVSWVNLPKIDNWIIARNYLEFISIVKANGMPKFVSFDHDLDRDTNMVVITRKQGELDGVNMGNGLDCAKWLVNYCNENKLTFPEWAVHSTSERNAPKITEYIQGFLNWYNQEIKVSV